MQLTIDDEDDQRTDAMMDMLLAKKRSEDHRNWLQEKGDMAEIELKERTLPGQDDQANSGKFNCRS